MMTFKELREQSGMNKKRFAEYFGIPYRTVQNWEAGVNKCPDYLLNLLEYKLKHEGLIRGVFGYARVATKEQVTEEQKDL
jgi:transcriptional regulator with XRE-family HTH domain